MANFSWCHDIQQIGDERERLRRAREALLEVKDSGMAHPYFDAEKPSHKAWSEDVLALHEIISELAPRYDVPEVKSKGYVEFDPNDKAAADEFVARHGRGGQHQVVPKVI